MDHRSTPDGRHLTFCRICESLCGLEVEVRGGQVAAIRPDDDHVATRGFACPKGLHQQELYGSPDRLGLPEKRVGDRWERIPWAQAIEEIGAKVRALRGARGADSIATYVGTAAGFGVLHPVFAQGFMTGLGSRSMYSSASQDCSSKFAVARELYGFPFTQPFPDLERTGCLVIVGANPVVSKWSFLQVPNPGATLRAMAARGARIFVVDPRRTETAQAAGEHVAIRPGTDAFFYLSFLHELERAGGVDRARAARHASGLEAVLAVVAPWPAERTAPVTGIPAARLRDLVEAYRTADGAALYCSTGVNMGPEGSLCFWLQEAINLASGNLDRPGGTLVSRGVIDFAAFGRRTGLLRRADRSRIGDFPSVNDGFPGGVLADEILTPGPGQVRALFVTGGNPLLTMPNGGRLKRALGELELLVTLDLFRNETGSLAHYVLPCTSPLERPDLPFVFPLMLGLQSKPYLQATRALLPPPGEARDEASIYLDLCRASGAPLFGSRVAQAVLEAARWLAAPFRRGPRALPQEALLSLVLRACRAPSFRRLLGTPHGLAGPPHRPGSFLGQRVVTDDGLVRLAPPVLLERARGLEARFERERTAVQAVAGAPGAGRLKLIGRRQVVTHNSWTHNAPRFAAAGTNALHLHPDDAAALGLGAGALADVTSEVATVRVPVVLDPALMPGTAALPHGWGHQHASGLSVASRTSGVNLNLLTPDGPARLEPVSGMAQLTALDVEVRPAAGPREPRSWSGLPAGEDQSSVAR